MHETDAFFARLPCSRLDGGQHRPAVVIAPCPGVAEPERGKQVQRCRLWSTIGGAHTDQDIKRICFGVFQRDIEVAIFREDAGVHQLVFGFMATAIAIRGDKIVIGEGTLWIFIQCLHI